MPRSSKKKTTLPAAPKKTKSKTSNKRRKKKLPAGMKRPLNQYMLFRAETQPTVKAENPNIPITQIAKLVGEQWRALSDAEKAPFIAKAKALKVAFDKEVAALPTPPPSPEPSDDEANEAPAPKPAKKQKKAKDPNAPKRPLNSYMLFRKDVNTEVKAELEANAQEGEKVNITMVARAVGQRWRDLTDKQKAPYDEKAKALREAYKQLVAVAQ